MKPEQFIREFGVDKAREVVEGAPKIGSYWQEYGADNGTYYGYDSFCGDWYEYWDIPNAPMWQKVFTKECFSFNRVEVNDLKRLVESVELINLFGSIKIAKDKVKMADFNGFLLISVPIENGLADVYIHKVEQAICDHESIYGGGDDL